MEKKVQGMEIEELGSSSLGSTNRAQDMLKWGNHGSHTSSMQCKCVETFCHHVGSQDRVWDRMGIIQEEFRACMAH